MTAHSTQSFRLESCAGPYGDRSLVILIDGLNLIEIIRDAELAYDSSIAGRYAGPPVRVLAPPSRLFFGELPDAGVRWSSSAIVPHTVPILGCPCGTEGCWPLHVRIERTDEYVTWSDFVNPFREDWDYVTSVGVLRFDAERYAEEIRSALSRFGGSDENARLDAGVQK